MVTNLLCDYPTNGVDLKGVHSDAGVVDLQLAVATVYYEHDPVHWRRKRFLNTRDVLLFKTHCKLFEMV